MKILKGKNGDVCPINSIELKTYKHPSERYPISPCLHCPHQKISWISKEGFVTVKCCADEVKDGANNYSQILKLYDKEGD